MKKFDLDQILAQAEADLDAEARERVSTALTAAVNAAAEEGREIVFAAAKAASERYEIKLATATDHDLSVKTRKAQETAQELYAATQRVRSETLSAAQEAIKRGYDEFKEGLSHAYRQIEDLENRTEAAVRTVISSEPKREMLKEEIAKASQATVTLQTAQEQAHRTLQQAKNMLLGAVILIVLSLLVGGWIGTKSGQRAAEQAHLDTMKRFAGAEESALARAEAMQAERDEIEANLRRIAALRDEIGLELIRDDHVVEIKLGDVMLRPWRGRTLVIVDKGRRIEPFSGGAALNDVSRYRGRLYRTAASE